MFDGHISTLILKCREVQSADIGSNNEIKSDYFQGFPGPGTITIIHGALAGSPENYAGSVRDTRSNSEEPL